MNPTHQSCSADLADLAPAIVHVMRSAIRQEMGSQLTLVQMRVLSTASRQPGISVSEIAAHVGLGNPATSTLIEGLVQRGLMVRSVAGDDRRRAVLTPTATGFAILAKAREISSERIAGLIAGLSGEDLAAIARAAAALRPVLAQHLDRIPPVGEGSHHD